MSAHTPGPWVVTVERDGSRYITCRGVRIAKLCGGTALSAYPEKDSAEAQTQRANLTVLAAAPDLLAVAELALQFATPKSGLADKLTAAIAKARGGE